MDDSKHLLVEVLEDIAAMGLYPGSPERTRDSLYATSTTNPFLQNSYILSIYCRLPKLAVKPWIRPHAPALILRRGWIVDPANAKLLRGLHDVVICKGHIQSIRSSAPSIDLPSDVENPTVVDLQGKYICP